MRRAKRFLPAEFFGLFVVTAGSMSLASGGAADPWITSGTASSMYPSSRTPGSSGTNTTGTIDGYQVTLSMQGDDLVLSVPEPSTLAMLGVGAIGLLAYGLRRRRAVKTTK